MGAVDQLIDASRRLCDDLIQRSDDLLADQGKVAWIYHPLEYARAPHEAYLTRFGGLGARTLMIGMNPGHGMGNTGVPFGCPEQVRDRLGITGLDVGAPATTHPRRQIQGLACPKPEVSGRRIWSMLGEIHGDVDTIHAHLFIVNHCPMWMFDEEGRNITPDKVSGGVMRSLLERCDAHLVEVSRILDIERLVAVGAYAEQRIRRIPAFTSMQIDRIPHPSPASPLANRNGGADWRALVRSVLT